jgi:hypothetical protein
VTEPRLPARVRRRMYYLLGGAALAALALGMLGVALTRVAPARAQVVDISVDPSMAKGASDARVTILEFSDYQ